MHLSIADRVTVSIDGADGSSPIARWVRQTLGPLASDAGPVGAPDLRFVIGPRLRASGPDLYPTRSGPVPGDDAMWVVDHLDHAAHVPWAALHERPVIVDGDMNPWFFHVHVYLPTLRAALWRKHAVLVHGTALGSDDRRFAMIGWTGCGKSRAMLRCLSEGTGFMGDDAFALRDDGVVGAVSALITLHSHHAPYITNGRSPIKRSPFTAASKTLRWASRRIRRFRKPSMALDTLAGLAWNYTKTKTSAPELFPDSPIVGPGRLDELLYLSRPDCDLPGREGVVRAVAATTATEYRYHADFEGAYRFARPALAIERIFPQPPDEHALIARALATTAINPVGYDGNYRDPYGAEMDDIEAVVRTIVRAA